MIIAMILSTKSASAQDRRGELCPAPGITRLVSDKVARVEVMDRSLPARPRETSPEARGLRLLRPYASRKFPVIFVDGLWGSSRQWSGMVKALEADPIVSEQFQFLTFDYPTGDPIPYSAQLLRRAIVDLRVRLDPDRSNPNWDQMVLIGHSMGGLLCKMMAVDSGSKLWNHVAACPFERLAGPEKARELLHETMVFQRVREVQRLVFIATPHRGSPMARGRVLEFATRLTRPAPLLEQARASLLASNGPDAFSKSFREGLASSINELAWEHPLLLAIDGLAIDPSVKRHSVIAVLNDTVRPGGGDGQVPYASAHHPGAVSELIVRAGHYCLEDGRVIKEVARILKEHAAECSHAKGRAGASVLANSALSPSTINDLSSRSKRP